MATVGEVRAVLTADTKKMVAAMEKATGSFEEFRKTLDKARGGMAKTEQAEDGLGKGLINAAKAVAAFMAVKKGMDLSGEAAATAKATKVFAHLGGNLDALRKSTKGMISDAQLVRKANLAETMGISADAFGQMGEIALAAAAKTGQGVDYLFDSLVTGSARQSKMILDNLGIMVNMNAINKEAGKIQARNAGMTEDAAKKQAFMNATLGQGQKMVEQVRAAGVKLSDPFQVFTAAIGNAAQGIGGMLAPAFEKLLGFVQPALDSFVDMTRNFANLNESSKNAAANITLAGTAAMGAAVGFKALHAAAGKADTSMLAVVKSILKMGAPMMAVIAVAASVAAMALVIRVAWEENWGGIRQITASTWQVIKNLAMAGVESVVVLVSYIAAGFAKTWNLVVGGTAKFTKWIVKIIGGAVDTALQIMGAFANSVASVMMDFPKLADALGIDAKSMKATAARLKALGDTGSSFSGLRDHTQNLEQLVTIEVTDPNEIADNLRKLPDALSGFSTDIAPVMSDMGTTAAETFKKGLALFGLNFGMQTAQAFNKNAKPPGGDKPADLTDEQKKAIADARKVAADAARDFALEMGVATSAIAAANSEFPELEKFGQDAANALADLQDKADAAGISEEQRARGISAVSQAQGILLAELLTAQAGAGDFAKMMDFARGVASDLGLDFDDLSKRVKRTAIKAEAGPGLSGAISGQVQGAATSMAASPEAGKALADSLGGSLSSALSGGVSAKGIGESLGAAMGSAAPMIGVAAGGAIGGVVAGLLSEMVGKIAEAFGPVVDAIANIVIADPRMKSGIDSFMGSFAPMASVMLPLALALGVLAPAIIATAVIFGAILLPVAAVVALALAGLALVVVGAALLLAVVLIPLAAAAALLGFWVTALALMPAITLGAAAAILSLAQETKAFKNIQAAMGAIMDDVIRAIEPLVENLYSIIPIMQTLGAAFIQVINAMAGSDAMAETFFNVMKMGGIAILSLAIASFKLQNAFNQFGAGILYGLEKILWLVQKLDIFGTATEQIEALRDSALSAANALNETQVDTDAMQMALDSLKDLTFADALVQGRNFIDAVRTMGDETKDAAASMKELNSSMLNVPEGFKVAAARFAASEGEVMGGEIQTTVTASDSAPVIVHGDIVLPGVEDPGDLGRKLRDAADTLALQQTGSTGGRTRLEANRRR